MHVSNDKDAGPYTTDASQALNGSRVIILLNSHDLGADERQALTFGHHMWEALGAHVEIWSGQESQSVRVLCERLALPFRVVTTPLPWSTSRLKQMGRLLKFAWTLRRARPNVILPYGFLPSVVCGVVWRLTGARSCVWNQGRKVNDRLGGRPEQIAVSLTPAFISNCQDGFDFLTELGAHKDRVSIVRAGVEPDPVKMTRDTWREQIGGSEDSFIAYIETNPETPQDHITLLNAWAIVVERLHRANRDPLLVIASRLEAEHKLEKAVAYDLELYDSIAFLGRVKDMSGLANAVELCLHAPLYEGCPDSVLESMAAGLPIIGSETATMREAVGPAGCSFLAAAGNAEAFADKIVKLAMDRELCARLGMENRQRIKTEFSMNRMCRQTLEVIATGLKTS